MAPFDPESEAFMWLDRIYLSMPWKLHARLSDIEVGQARLELLVEQLIHKFDQLEIRMTAAEAVAAKWQEVANMLGRVAAEVTSIRQQADGFREQLAAALANQDADKAAAIEQAMVEHLAADAARADGLIADMSALITTDPDIPAEVPDVPVPEPGEPAEEPHVDNTLPGDLPPE